MKKFKGGDWVKYDGERYKVLAVEVQPGKMIFIKPYGFKESEIAGCRYVWPSKVKLIKRKI